MTRDEKMLQLKDGIITGKGASTTDILKTGEEFVALEQGFTKHGHARIRTERGWSTYCAGGLAGHRNFLVIKHKKPTKTGRIKLRVQRLPRRKLLRVVVVMAKELQQMDTLRRNDVYVKVKVNNGEEQRTATIDGSTDHGGGANPVWNEGYGDSLAFEDVLSVDHIAMGVWDEVAAGEATDGLIGVISLNLKEITDPEKERIGAEYTWEQWVAVTDRLPEDDDDEEDADDALVHMMLDDWEQDVVQDLPPTKPLTEKQKRLKEQYKRKYLSTAQAHQAAGSVE